MYRSLCYTSMVGRAGASKGAPVSDKAGKTNSVRSATSRLVSWVVV
ncbi:ash family protein [Enterobacter sp.]